MDRWWVVTFEYTSTKNSGKRYTDWMLACDDTADKAAEQIKRFLLEQKVDVDTVKILDVHE